MQKVESRRRLKVAATVLALAILAVRANAAQLLVEDTIIPATFPEFPGKPVWSLEGVVVRMNDGQRHPVAAFIDGEPEINPRPMLLVARELARRGWTAVAVMRPGWGKSQGGQLNFSCGTPGAYEEDALEAAQTLRETIRVVGARPYADPTRSLAIGHSTGGIGVTALVADPPPNLVGAINFAGNNGSNYPRDPDRPCNVDGLVATFAKFGVTARIPMLWIYAENDHHMGPANAHAYYNAFTKAGGNATLEMAPAMGIDGHTLYANSDAVPVWSAYLDQFFAAQKLAMTSQPATIDPPAVSPPQGLSAEGRAGFARYLLELPHKAFVSGPNHWQFVGRRETEQEAETTALDRCAKAAGAVCKVIMRDDQPQ